ncbi:endonuclease domain-containing protein [Brevundimonas goettingensis]|uniref:Endonuclease domain-containing protein n=1 Tax=Brevundimonas goettingensis TaxID=2774190 RepID=A0A975C0K8_9CAUL|nr:endonuclease domain-containing protein [Brevundimonas goettingensis]QTC91250.1 endonuclease domain-containing protein [Brevundimonas goettingensis]
MPKPDAVTYHRAGDLRRSLTPPEARLWICLKNGGLAGLKFRRQRPEGPYILDFYCVAAKLAVEVDGAVHDQPDQIEHDRRRTAWLARQGIEVIRFQALSIRDNLDGVLVAIREAAEARLRR